MSTNPIDDSKEIILGSGELYMDLFDGSTIPEDSVIEVDDKRAGNILGGAKLYYSIASQSVSSDNGRVKTTVLTEETIKFVTGMVTWTPTWMKALIPTARLDTAAPSNRRRYKIGGLDYQHYERYLLRFVHKKKDGRKVRITITGPNTGELGIAFDKEKPTTIDAEITAEPLDTEGTLVIFDEELEAAEAAAAAAGESGESGESGE